MDSRLSCQAIVALGCDAAGRRRLLGTESDAVAKAIHPFVLTATSLTVLPKYETEKPSATVSIPLFASPPKLSAVPVAIGNASLRAVETSA